MNQASSLGACLLHDDAASCPNGDLHAVLDMIGDVPDLSNIWSDGIMEPISHLDIQVAGTGVFTHAPACIYDDSRRGHAQDPDGRFEGSSHMLDSVTGPLQSVQRAECWRVILALQAFPCIHVGNDNLNVLRGVARLLEQTNKGNLLHLVSDGDLATVHSMLRNRRYDTVKVAKVKGHAEQVRVVDGSVLQADLCGTDGADTAADLGRL